MQRSEVSQLKGSPKDMVSPVQVHEQRAAIGAKETEWAHLVPDLEKLALRAGRPGFRQGRRRPAPEKPKREEAPVRWGNWTGFPKERALTGRPV